MKIWVAGEGPNDIGSLARGDSDQTYPGVLQILLERLDLDIDVVGGSVWKSIPKLRVGSGGLGAEGRTVAGLRLHAEEAGVEALVFVRDRDGERSREDEVEAALATPGLPTAGVCVVERLEHWLLAIGGRKKAHKLSAKQVSEWLQSAGITEKQTEDYVTWLSERSLEQIPQDAKSLLTWLDRVRALAAQ